MRKFSIEKIKGFRLVFTIIAFVGLFLSLASWALSSPAGSSPDDDYHLASIYCSATAHTDLCREGETNTNREVSTDITNIYCFSYHEEINASCQVSQWDLNSPAWALTERGNFSGEYPPVFYAVMGTVANSDVQSSVLFMRFINLSLFLALSILLLAGMKAENRLIPGALWLLVLVPLGLFLIPSTNPSSWAVTGVITAWMSLYTFFRVEGRKQYLAGTTFVLSCVIALGSRSDSAIFICIAVLLSLVKPQHFAQLWPKLILPIVAAVASCVVFLSARQGTAALSGLGGLETGNTERSPLSVLGFNFLQLPSLFAGIYGSWKLGWLDTEMPAIVWLPVLVLVAAVLFTQIRFLKRTDLIRSALAFAAVVFIPMYLLQVSFSHVGENVQPRYLLPLWGIFVATLLVQLKNWRSTFNFSQLLILWVMIVVAQSFALYTNMARYISGLGPGMNWSLDASLSSGGWWWNTPISPMAVWVIGSLGFSIFAAVVISSWKDNQSPDSLSLTSKEELELST